MTTKNAHTSTVERIREFVQMLLTQGEAPADVSHALAFIATELGLFVANDPVEVFPVVLTGISDAVSARRENTENQQGPKEDLAVAPCNPTLH